MRIVIAFEATNYYETIKASATFLENIWYGHVMYIPGYVYLNEIKPQLIL